MNNGKLWEEALVGASYEQLAEFAAEVPRLLLVSSVAGSDSVVRSTGLVLTKNEIISIKKYVSIAFSFPTTLPTVTDYLRYGVGEDGGTGLRPNDFLSTFQMIRDHAETWSDLREKIMMTSTDLEMFGAVMRIWGRQMERFYDSDEATDLIKKYKIKTYEDLKQVEYEWEGVFPGIKLDPDTVLNLQSVLHTITDDIGQYLERTSEIKTKLDTFGNTLENKVIPAIGRRLEFINNNKYPGEIDALNKRITDRAADIERMNLEYKALVEKSLGSAAAMNIFGLGMAIYLGVEAENIRAERNRLNKLQEQDIQTLNSKNVTLGSLKRVEHDLQNCKVAALDAEVATNNLRYNWNVIADYVKKSATNVGAITDALKLYEFMVKFQLVVASWVKIEERAGELARVFSEADREYQGEVVSSRMATRSMVFSIYPSLDLGAMSSARKLMRAGSALAVTLSEQFDYLPDLVDQFARRVDDVFNASRELQGSSDSALRRLNDTFDEMVLLDKMLARETARGNEDAIESINANRMKLLTDTADQVKSAQYDIQRSLNNINVFFDKTQTTGFGIKLEADIEYAKARESDFMLQMSELQEIQNGVDKAVKLIESKGIELIGNDVNLTIDKLKSINMTMPEIELVMMAIDQLKKTIEGIVKDVSFLFLLAQSKLLREKIDVLRASIAEQVKLVTQCEGKIKLIGAIHNIDGHCVVYRTHYEPAVDAFALFGSSIGHGSTVVPVDTFFAEADKFIEFLKPLSIPLK